MSHRKDIYNVQVETVNQLDGLSAQAAWLVIVQQSQAKKSGLAKRITSISLANYSQASLKPQGCGLSTNVQVETVNQLDGFSAQAAWLVIVQQSQAKEAGLAKRITSVSLTNYSQASLETWLLMLS